MAGGPFRAGRVYRGDSSAHVPLVLDGCTGLWIFAGCKEHNPASDYNRFCWHQPVAACACQKKHAEYYEQLQFSARKESYITAQATDSAAGKDIRIYRLLDWFLEKYDTSLKEMGRIYGVIHDWYLLRNLSNAFLQLVMNAMAFGILAYMLAAGKITAAEFVFYIGLVNGFSRYFEEMLRQIMMFNNTSASISYMREFLRPRIGGTAGKASERKSSGASAVLP